MPRPKRICIPGLPHHVVQRGNDRQATFYNHDDFAMYVTLLNEAAIDHAASIHSYALMANHVHLLLTPAATNGLSLVFWWQLQVSSSLPAVDHQGDCFRPEAVSYGPFYRTISRATKGTRLKITKTISNNTRPE